MCKFDKHSEEVIEWLEDSTSSNHSMTSSECSSNLHKNSVEVSIPEKWELPTSDSTIHERVEDFPIINDVSDWYKNDFEELECSTLCNNSII